MSQNDTGANEPHDDAQHTEHADSSDEVETLTSLTEAQEAFSQVEQRRERHAYTLDTEAGAREVWFEIRALEADERDELESLAARERQKAEQRSRSGSSGIEDMDIWPVKRAQLEYGIVGSSLEDFKPHREDHLKSLPSFVQDDLFTEIDELGTLDKEVRDGFQGMG